MAVFLHKTSQFLLKTPIFLKEFNLKKKTAIWK